MQNWNMENNFQPLQHFAEPPEEESAERSLQQLGAMVANIPCSPPRSSRNPPPDISGDTTSEEELPGPPQKLQKRSNQVWDPQTPGPKTFSGPDYWGKVEIVECPFTPDHGLVIEIIKRADEGEGVHINVIKTQAPQLADRINRILQYLTSEGYIYTTCSWNHFKVVNGNQ